MEFKTSTITAIFAICMLFLQVLAQPMIRQDEMDDELSADKRPKYLDTRTLTGFKKVLLMALEELVNEDKLSPSILSMPEMEEKTKRGRYMGICVQRTSSGAFRPHPCWKGAN